MTDRKPAGLSFESWVDMQIREARERGEFDNLAGHGKPLASIDGQEDELWWIKQLLKREGVTFTPPALALRKSVEDMLGSLGRLSTEAMVRDLVEELNTRIRAMNRIPPIDGPPTSLFPLDVEEVVSGWPQRRAAYLAAHPEPLTVPVATAPGGSTRRRLFRRRSRN